MVDVAVTIAADGSRRRDAEAPVDLGGIPQAPSRGSKGRTSRSCRAEASLLDPLHQVVAVHRLVELVRIGVQRDRDVRVGWKGGRAEVGVETSGRKNGPAAWLGRSP